MVIPSFVLAEANATSVGVGILKASNHLIEQCVPTSIFN